MEGPSPEELYIGDNPAAPSIDYSFFQVEDVVPYKLLGKALLGIAALRSIKPVGGVASTLMKEYAPKAIKEAEKRIVEAASDNLEDAAVKVMLGQKGQSEILQDIAETLYHGGAGPIKGNVLDPTLSGIGKGDKLDQELKLLYATSDPNWANYYAESAPYFKYKTDPTISEDVFFAPWVMPLKGQGKKIYYHPDASDTLNSIEKRDVIKQAISEGYDTIVFGQNKPYSEYVFTSPSQLKSIFDK